jgi:hypothetical protein
MGNRSGRQRLPPISGQFAPRLIEMLESPAYRQLSLAGRRVLDRLEIELAHHGGLENGALPVTYDDFEKYGIDRKVVHAAIAETVALGFVRITRPGMAGNADFRRPNLFLLTYRPAKGEHRGDGCHDWRMIKTRADAARVAREARGLPEKTRRPTPPHSGKKPDTSREIPHRKPGFHSGNFPTTKHSGESPTTLDISGPPATSKEVTPEATPLTGPRLRRVV